MFAVFPRLNVNIILNPGARSWQMTPFWHKHIFLLLLAIIKFWRIFLDNIWHFQFTGQGKIDICYKQLFSVTNNATDAGHLDFSQIYRNFLMMCGVLLIDACAFPLFQCILGYIISFRNGFHEIFLGGWGSHKFFDRLRFTQMVCWTLIKLRWHLRVSSSAVRRF